MTNSVGGATIELTVDSSGVESGLDRVDGAVRRSGRTLQNLGSQGSNALNSVGAGGAGAAARVEAATRNIAGAVERATSALVSGKKAGSEYFEDLARRRGGDLAILGPLIAQLREVEAAQARAAAATGATAAAQQAAAEAARVEAAAQREVAQAQAGRDAFLSSLREQLALYGRSTEEVLRYRAAQAGVTESAAPLILQLQNLKAAHEAVAEASRSEANAQRQAAQVQTNRDSFLNGLREQIALYGKSSEEVLRYRAVQAGVADSAAPLIAQLQRVKAAQDAVTEAARATERAQQQAAQVQSGRDAFIASLQQQSAAIGKTRADLLELQAAQMGLTTQAAPFITQLRAAEQGLNNAGMSARATAAALRGVPAQFTDIITSIQGGQAPLTVFLQQGGQLKDMFGGAGNAAKALGGYVLGLINPFTVVAAAAAAVAVAYVQGNKEVTAYGKALITTGNAAGTTAGQISNMARTISNSVGTQGAAAEALIAIVGTGRVSAENLQRFSLVAVQAQRALGQSVGDTAAQFVDLAKGPAATLLKLNEQYHFLTAEVYRQVKALENQGRAIEAAATAQNAYATALGSVATKVDANLGTLQKAWKGVTDVAKGAWDAMLNVGREDSLEQKLANVQKNIKKAQGPFDASVGGNSEARSQLTNNLALEKSLKSQIALAGQKAVADAAGNKAREAGLAWAQEEEKYLSRAQLLAQEITKARTQGAAAGVDPKLIEERITAINRKYADIFNSAIDSQIEAIKRRGAIEEEVAKRSGVALASARTAGLATSLAAQFDYAEQVEKLDQQALAREKVRLQAELALTADRPNSQKEQAALRGQIAEVEAKALTRTLQLKHEIFELDVKDSRRAAASLSDLEDKRSADLAALNQQLLAQRDANILIGASKEQINAFNRTLIEEAALRKEVEAAILDTIIGREDEAEKLRASAAAMRDLGQAQADAVLKSADLDQHKRVWESIDETARDTFVSIFDSGKSAFDRLRDTLKNGLLDLLYQMTIKKWIFNIGAQVSGFAGIGDMGSTSSGAGAGGVGQVGSLLQTGKGIYDTITNGFAGVSSSIGGLFSSVGNYFGSAQLSSFGTGMTLNGSQAYSAAEAYNKAGMTETGSSLSSGSSAGSAASVAAAWLAAAAVGRKLGNAISDGYSVNGGNGGGFINFSTLTNSVPILGGVVGGLVNRAFGMREKEVKAAGIRGTLGADSFVGETYSDWRQKGGWFRSDKSGTDKAPVDAETSKAFSDTYGQLKAASADFAKTLGVNADYLATRAQALNITLTKDVEANKKAIDAFFLGVADTVATELVPSLGTFKLEGEAVSTTLQRLAGDYKAVDLALMTIGRTSQEAFGAAGVASIAARERLIAAAGGIDALAAGTAYFAQNFLSPEEQMKPIIANVQKQLSDLGFAGVSTTADFKAAVLDLTQSGKLATEAGAAQYASLLQLAPQFKQMTDYTDSLGTSAASAAAKLAEINGTYEEQIKALKRSMLSSAEARAADVAGMDASTLKLYERLEALKAEEAAANTNAGIKADIDALVKASLPLSEQRALEVKDMASSTLALYERREALTSEAKAANEAKAAAENLSNTNAGYQQQIDEIFKSRMSEAQVRALETKGMAASTLALYDRLAALKGEEAANTARQQGIETARGMVASAYNAESAALRSIIERSKQASSALRDFGKDLLVGTLSPLSERARITALREQFEDASADNLQAASSAYLDALKAQGDGLAFAQGFAAVQGAIERAAAASDGQAVFAEMQLGALNASVSGILLVNESVLSVRDALAAFKTAVGGTGAGSGNSTAASAAAADVWGQTATGWGWVRPTKYNPYAPLSSVPRHANGGLANGWSLVGEEGPELVNFTQPGRVYTAEQSHNMLSGSDNGVLAAELKLMREELAAALRVIAASSNKTAETMDDLASGRKVLQTESAS